MKNWETDLTAGGETLGKVKIKGGILQADSLSLLSFVVCHLLYEELKLDMKLEKPARQ